MMIGIYFSYFCSSFYLFILILSRYWNLTLGFVLSFLFIGNVSLLFWIYAGKGAKGSNLGHI